MRIPATHPGASLEQYRALREGAGLVDRTHRGRLLLSGADRRAYLQGLLTNDILALTPGTGCYAAYLTAQGRMISDMRVFETGDEILLDLEGAVAPAVLDRLSQFIFSEDVEIRDASADTSQVGVYGPRAAHVVAAAAGIPASELDAMPVLAVKRVDAVDVRYVLRSDDIGVAGFDLVVNRRLADAVAQRLRDAGAVGVEDAAAEVTRIEGGRPRFGVDMNDDTIPLEAGIDERAISLTKGCYVGQEIIIRVLHRGQGRVARRLVGLLLGEDAAVPAAGDVIRSGDREIGRVTSSTRSLGLNRPVALGYVHRDFTQPGTPVTVEHQAANVKELPFVKAS